MEYHITQYDLEQGALEIQYMEEFFGEFPRKKTAAEIVRRLSGRNHLILLANAERATDLLRRFLLRRSRLRRRGSCSGGFSRFLAIGGRSNNGRRQPH